MKLRSQPAIVGVILLAVAVFADLRGSRIDSGGDVDRTGTGFQESSNTSYGLSETGSRHPSKSNRDCRAAFEVVRRIRPVTGYPDPADGYFEAWLAVKESENVDLTTQEKIESLTQAYAIFRGLQEEHMNWKDVLVKAPGT